MAAPNWQQVAWLRFLLAVALIAILTITSRYVLGQPWHEFVKDLLPNLTATSIGLATGWILFRGISESDQLLDKIVTKTDALIHDEVQRTTKAVLDAVYESAEIAKSVTPLAPRQIRDHLALVASSPGEYRFLGNSGKHLAAVSIPHLATIEAHSYEVPIWIQLLDPDGDDGIRRYCDDRKCSKDEVRAEIYATILLAFVWSRTNPRFRIERLSVRTMPTHFRVDWSRTHCVITTEGKNDPGLALSNTMATPNHLHAKVRDQLVASFTSDRVIVMPPNFAKIAAGTRLADVSDDLLRTGLSTIAPKDGNLETLSESVISALRKRSNPYA